MKKVLLFICTAILLISCNKEKIKWKSVANIVKESMEETIDEVDKVTKIYLDVRLISDTANNPYYRVQVLSSFIGKDGEDYIYQQTYFIEKQNIRVKYAYNFYSDLFGMIYGFYNNLEEYIRVQHVFKITQFGKETFKRKSKGMLEYSF
ncbi:MAG: hypothetical protein LC122_05215 [Chitinophagales bacterium]|nr:hypothetical protein [Chitinophagales bacterium]